MRVLAIDLDQEEESVQDPDLMKQLIERPSNLSVQQHLARYTTEIKFRADKSKLACLV